MTPEERAQPVADAIRESGILRAMFCGEEEFLAHIKQIAADAIRRAVEEERDACASEAAAESDLTGYRIAARIRARGAT